MNLGTMSNGGEFGFRIFGGASSDYFAYSVSSAGDVNGDGVDDLIIGGYYMDYVNKHNCGAAVVLFGHYNSTSFLDIDTSKSFGTKGFIVIGAAPVDLLGYSVSAAGDVNNDGIDDIAVGAPYANFGTRSNTGTTYVIYGSYATPTSQPSSNPSSQPSAQPSRQPSNQPSRQPSCQPSRQPSAAPSQWVDPAYRDVDMAGFTSGAEGFRMVGAAANDNYGWSVSGIGDVNGDGIDDVAVGGSGADPEGRTDAGAVMVIYGCSTADTAFSEVSAAAVPSGSGFMIYGAAAQHYTGYSIDTAGDVNGDAIGDIVVGAYGAGTAYVLFGRNASNPFPDVVDLASFVSGAATGFKVTGAAAGDWLGVSVSGAGDMNGDGYDDVIVGAHNADDLSRTDAGTAYIIFGHSSTASTFTDIAAGIFSTGTTGFKVFGAAAGDNLGFSVSGAGDYNGDGYDDVIIGASGADPLSKTNAGISFVVFGHSGVYTDIDLLSFTSGAAGFKILGGEVESQAGRSVDGAGDVNGDGCSDVVVGGTFGDYSGRVDAGAAYVIFGRRGVPAFVDVDLATMMYGTLGLRVFGAIAHDYLGHSVSRAGDVNGDGIDDLLVGSSGANAVGRTDAGSVVVIFGHSNSTSFPDIDTLHILGELGYRIYGAAGDDYFGWSVSAAGDVNSDGIDDILVGAYSVNVGEFTEAGAAYVIFGSYAKPTSQPSSSPSSQPSSYPSMQPSRQPTAQPNRLPTSNPSSQPSHQPSSQPTCQPTCKPSRQPSSSPSSQPTRVPTNQPSEQPSSRPTMQPSAQPSRQPVSHPSLLPSVQPSAQPTSLPSAQPSGLPSLQPMSSPSAQPSCQPSQRPSSQPSVQPTLLPSAPPTVQPSSQPSSEPSVQPSVFPSAQPSSQPSVQPSSAPSTQPTGEPSVQPSSQPSMCPTNQPSALPSSQPSNTPSSAPSGQPSSQPSNEPSVQPTMQPTSTPSSKPTAQPSALPSVQPSDQPSTRPSTQPNAQPTVQPSSQPSMVPTAQPSAQPSCIPTLQPTRQPTNKPTSQPTSQPTQQPSMQPSTLPTAQPSQTPSEQPSAQPTSAPSGQPSGGPTGQPSELPTQQPSPQPSCTPSSQPTGSPTSQPSLHPSGQPSALPTRQPTQKPSSQPSITPSRQSTVHPSSQPTTTPTGQPSTLPSIQISTTPSSQPTADPSAQPFARPSSQPSRQPSAQPFPRPSSQPSRQPSAQPSRQPSRTPSAMPTAPPSSQPSSAPTVSPSSQPSGFPSTLPSISPTSQPRTLPTSLPSSAPTSAPTVAPPSGEWVTLLSSGSSLHLLTEINGDVVAGGSSTNPSARAATTASCFWFDGVTGTLKGKYMFSWEFTTALSAITDVHGKQRLLVSGTKSFPQRSSYVAICDVVPQQQKLICSTTVVPSMMATSTVSNPNAKAILSIGSWLGAPALVILDADGGYVRSFSYSNSQLLEYTLRFTAMGVVPGFFGSCVAGINSQTDGSQQIVIGWADSYRSIIPPLVIIPQSGRKIVNEDKLVQCAILLPGVFHSVVGGGISLEDDSLGTQPYIVRTNMLLGVLMFGFRYVASGSESHINDMVLVGGHIFIIADTVGLAPQPSRHHLSVLQIVAATGEIYKQVRVSGPGDLTCSKIQLAQDRLLLGCNIFMESDSQALLLSASQDLKFLDLPPGYEGQQLDDEFLAKSLPFAIVSKNSLVTQPLSPQISRLHFNSTQGSFAQEVTSRPPSLAPSRLPTAAPTTWPPTPTPTTHRPSSQPSGRPSSQPSRQPSSRPTAQPTVSARPTSAPSSSTPTSTHRPTWDPSSQPTGTPSTQPSVHPSAQPSAQPFTDPTSQPSAQPSEQPLSLPTAVPSAVTTPPSPQPSRQPQAKPTADPTYQPTTITLRTTWPTTSTSLSDEHEEPSYALVVGVAGAGALSLLLLVWLAYRWTHARKRDKEVFLKVVPSSGESASSPTALNSTAPVIQQSSAAVDELRLAESGGESQVDSESESIDLSSEDTASSYSNDAVSEQADLSSKDTESSYSNDAVSEQGDLFSNDTASIGSVDALIEQWDVSDEEQ